MKRRKQAPRPTKFANYQYGTFNLKKDLRGTEISAELAACGGKLSKHIQHAAQHGTPRERLYLAYVTYVRNVGFQIHIGFHKRTPLHVKQYIRRWAIQHGYQFYDKSYEWTKFITPNTDHIALGPWSKQPRPVNNRGVYRSFTFKST